VALVIPSPKQVDVNGGFAWTVMSGRIITHAHLPACKIGTSSDWWWFRKKVFSGRVGKNLSDINKYIQRDATVSWLLFQETTGFGCLPCPAVEFLEMKAKIQLHLAWYIYTYWNTMYGTMNLTLPDMFPVTNGWKLEDALSPLFLNFALDTQLGGFR
jgi:hypothetical protein